MARRVARVRKPAEIDPAFAAARCNDGTPFAYEVRAGAEPVWVVNLAGGYFCDDAGVACSERQRRLTTTLPGANGAPTRMKTDGVFSTDPALNPTFAGAHHVDAHYCSSDLWLGDSVERRATTGDPDNGWYFSGRTNVDALFRSLITNDGLDDSDPNTRVLVIGTSAGGAGLMGNAAQIRDLLPVSSAAGRVKLVLDGSWVPPLPDASLLPVVNKWGPVLPTCDAELRARGDDPVQCIYGAVATPYLKAIGLPFLVQVSALDQTQTPVFGVDTPEERQLWQAALRRSLEGVPWVWSVGLPYHVVAIDAELYGKGPEGTRFRDVLTRFWAGDPPEQVFVRWE